jgi:ZIP Zinc transporter
MQFVIQSFTNKQKEIIFPNGLTTSSASKPRLIPRTDQKSSSLGNASSLNAQLMWITTISIMCHEIPREIGDYWTLLRTGYTRGQTILMQLWTAIAVFAGTATAMYT